MRSVVKAVGYILLGLVLLGLALRLGSALFSGRAFYGVNYKGLPLGTYSTLVVVGVASLVGLVHAVRWLKAIGSEGVLGRSVSPVSEAGKLHDGDMEDELPPDVIRSPEAVARRALALFSVVGVSLGAPREDVLRWLQETGVDADLAPSEKRFLGTPMPSRKEIINGSWLSERLAVLCWALGALSDFPPPDEQCDTGLFQEVLPPFADVSTASFIANAKLLPDDVLIAKADELLQHHWEARNAALTGIRSKTPLDIEVIQERHHAINWVIGHNGAP